MQDVGSIIIKHGGYSARLPENYANVKKEFSDFQYGELYPVLEKLGSKALFLGSPTLHKQVVTVESDQPSMLDIKQIEERSQSRLIELEKWIKDGKTAETISYLNGHQDMLNVKNRFGRTLAHIAVTANLNDDTSLIHYLASKKVNLTTGDIHGTCPLEFVVWNAGPKTTAALIQHGAHLALSKEQLLKIKTNAEETLINYNDEQNAQSKASAVILGDLLMKYDHAKPKQ